MARKLTPADIHRKVKEAHNGHIKWVGGELNGTASKLTWKCSNPDHDTWVATANDVVNNRRRGCPHCAGNRKHTPEYIRTRVQEVHDGHIKWVGGELISMNHKLTWKCSNPDHDTWEAAPSTIINRKHGCPDCSGGRKHTPEAVHKRVQEVHNGHIKWVGGEFIDLNHKLTWKCSNPDHDTWETTTSSIVHMQTGCPDCTNRRKQKPADIHRRVKEVHAGHIKWVGGELNGTASKLTWKCSNPDHDTWVATANNVVNCAQGCPKCNGFATLTEDLLVKRIKNALRGIKISQGYRPEHLSTTKTGAGQHYDIYLHELDIAIEYHGEQHYTPIKWFGGDDKFELIKNLDKRKRMLSKQNGVTQIDIHHADFSHKSKHNNQTDFMNTLVTFILKIVDYREKNPDAPVQHHAYHHVSPITRVIAA